MKHCPKCSTTKQNYKFYKNSTKSDGMDSMCKLCRKATNAKRKSSEPKRSTIKERLREGYKVTLAYYKAWCKGQGMSPAVNLFNAVCSHPGCARMPITYTFSSYKAFWRRPDRIGSIVHTHCAKHNKSFTKLRNMKLEEVLD
jgi:hypothetical protein